MITLTKDQHDALTNNGKEPAKVIDPVTNDEYVLLSAQLYARVRCLFEEDDFKVSDAYPAIDRAFAEGWDDPKMADYDHFEDFKK